MLAEVSLAGGLVQRMVFGFALGGGEVSASLDVLGEELFRYVRIVV